MIYKIYKSAEFEKDFMKLDASLQQQVTKEIWQLEQNPFVGKSLGYRFFREKKIGKYRMYYLIYEEFVIVFIIAWSGKKDQQKSINIIKNALPEYLKEIKKKVNELSKV